MHISSNHLKIQWRHRIPLTWKNSKLYFLTTKIILYNYSTLIKEQKMYYLYATVILIYSPYWNFINCPNNVLSSYFSPDSISNTGSSIACILSCVLVSFNLEQPPVFFFFFLSFLILMFLKITGQLFYTMSQFRLV